MFTDLTDFIDFTNFTDFHTLFDTLVLVLVLIVLLMTRFLEGAIPNMGLVRHPSPDPRGISLC